MIIQLWSAYSCVIILDHISSCCATRGLLRSVSFLINLHECDSKTDALVWTQTMNWLISREPRLVTLPRLIIADVCWFLKVALINFCRVNVDAWINLHVLHCYFNREQMKSNIVGSFCAKNLNTNQSNNSKQQIWNQSN